jgi:hypothetical protein
MLHVYMFIGVYCIKVCVLCADVCMYVCMSVYELVGSVYACVHVACCLCMPVCLWPVCGLAITIYIYI